MNENDQKVYQSLDYVIKYQKSTADISLLIYSILVSVTI